MKKSLLRQVGDEVESLIPRVPPPKKPVVSTGPPLYLRTDLVYGLQSGGSVGHIAGVLTIWADSRAKPIFITTDRIPTVDESVETHVLRPLGRFRDFRELPSIEFNQ